MNEEYFRACPNPLRAKDVAIVFNVHVNTVYRLAKSGELKSVIQPQQYGFINYRFVGDITVF